MDCTVKVYVQCMLIHICGSRKCLVGGLVSDLMGLPVIDCASQRLKFCENGTVVGARFRVTVPCRKLYFGDNSVKLVGQAEHESMVFLTCRKFQYSQHVEQFQVRFLMPETYVLGDTTQVDELLQQEAVETRFQIAKQIPHTGEQLDCGFQMAQNSPSHVAINTLVMISTDFGVGNG